MIEGAFSLAFALGLVAAFNPCGFAMLPAYLSYFLGLDDGSGDAEASVLRALGVGASVTLGFTLVFLGVGIPISAFSVAIGEWLPYLTVAVGVGLVGLGIAMLRGFQPTVSLPKLDRGGQSREFGSMFLFGASYGVASLSCTMPLFIAQVISSSTAPNFLSRVSMFLVFSAGMALVLMTLTVAIALARRGIVTRLRNAVRYVNYVAGVLLVLAGGYVTYYGVWEIRVLRDPGFDVGPAEQVNRWNSEVTNWIVDFGPTRLGMILAAVIGVVVVLAVGWRYSRPTGDAR